MRPANKHISKKIISGLVVNSISATQRSDFCVSANDRHDEKRSAIKESDLSCARQFNNSKAHLNIDTIQKMIQRFLVEKSMSKDKLAGILGATIEELELLALKKGEVRLVTKISLPLIKFYCKARWKQMDKKPA